MHMHKQEVDFPLFECTDALRRVHCLEPKVENVVLVFQVTRT